MNYIVLKGITDQLIAINVNMIIGIRKCNDKESGCQINIDTNNFTYKVKEDFSTVLEAIRNAG